MRKFLLSLIEQFGYKVTKFNRKAAGPYADIQDKTFWEFYQICQPYTMTSVERMFALYQATNNVHWEGCRKAVDEYFAEQKQTIFLQRIDYTGRLAIKK